MTTRSGCIDCSATPPTRARSLFDLEHPAEGVLGLDPNRLRDLDLVPEILQGELHVLERRHLHVFLRELFGNVLGQIPIGREQDVLVRERTHDSDCIGRRNDE